jgi:hypothetical protein
VGIHEPLPWDDLSLDKVRMVRYAIMWRVGMNMTGVCMFHPWTPQQTMDLIAAATRWNTSVMDLWLWRASAPTTLRGDGASTPAGLWPRGRLVAGALLSPVWPKGQWRGAASTARRFAQAIQECVRAERV